LYPVDIIKHSLKRRKRISFEEVKNITQKYKEGMSLGDISKLLGFSKNKIRNILLKQGIVLRSVSTQVNRKCKIKSGKLAAWPYFGFCYFQGKIIKEPKEYPTLQLIYRFWNEGKTNYEITLNLNKAKILTRTGKSWSWSTIKYIVSRFENEIIVPSKGGQLELR